MTLQGNAEDVHGTWLWLLIPCTAVLESDPLDHQPWPCNDGQRHAPGSAQTSLRLVSFVLTGGHSLRRWSRGALPLSCVPCPSMAEGGSVPEGGLPCSSPLPLRGRHRRAQGGRRLSYCAGMGRPEKCIGRPVGTQGGGARILRTRMRRVTMPDRSLHFHLEWCLRPVPIRPPASPPSPPELVCFSTGHVLTPWHRWSQRPASLLSVVRWLR